MSKAVIDRRTAAVNHLIDQVTQVAPDMPGVGKNNGRFEKVRQFFEEKVFGRKDPFPNPKVIIDEIDTRDNDREVDLKSEEFLALKESIRSQGLIQRPLLTLGRSDHKPFLCISGHRRIAALKALGHETTPADLVLVEEDQDIRLLRLSENIIREDLGTIDLAEAVSRVKISLQESTSGLARALNKDRKYVTWLLKIADWSTKAKIIAIKNSDLINRSDLMNIAKKSLSDDEIILSLEKVLKKKTKDPQSNATSKKLHDRSGESFPTPKKISLRNAYFKEKKLSIKDQELIIGFLRDNNIRGWF